MCAGEKKCIYSAYVCNGYANCENAADEINCSKNKFKKYTYFDLFNFINYYSYFLKVKSF